EDQRDLVAEVVDDLYVRKFHAAERPGALSRADALRVADAAVNNPVAPIEPSWAPRTTPAGMHRSLAEAVRREMERRKRQAGVLTYDDLLIRLRAALDDPVHGPRVRARAPEANRAHRVIGAPVTAPLRLRVLHREDGLVTITPQKHLAQAAHSRALIAQDLADDLVALLSSGARVERRHRDGSAAGDEEVRPGHVAVLVRTNRQANLVREALAAVGITAVINGAGSVFATPVAREWLRLLESLERPTSVSRARSAALTVFLGWSAEAVAAAGDEIWEAVHFTLNRWAGVLRRHGVASLLELISASEGLPARLLTDAGGERALTDLRHVGQLLHTV